jgi:hypothetical protein
LLGAAHQFDALHAGSPFACCSVHACVLCSAACGQYQRPATVPPAKGTHDDGTPHQYIQDGFHRERSVVAIVLRMRVSGAGVTSVAVALVRPQVVLLSVSVRIERSPVAAVIGARA